MINKRSKLIQNAGEYANFTQVKTCNLEPNVDQYKAPCTSRALALCTRALCACLLA